MSTSSHPRLTRRPGLLVATAATALLAGLLAAPSAQSAPPPTPPDAQCPDPYPVDEITGGMPVSGLTVSEGTVPEAFEGEIIGVIDGGIAPGIDLIVADLTSPAIDAAGGIWAGMSGSPVYAEDGRIIGAVSYGLSNGANSIAGLTPAEAMREWLDPIEPTVKTSAPAEQIDLPARTASDIVAAGLASPAELSGGLSQLPMPIALSGTANKKRLSQISEILGLEDALVYPARASADATVGEIVAGGNVAVTLSYGDVTYGGVGTVTQVCGDEVLAFGHPAFWLGPTSLTMHGADAVYVQDDPFYPYKAANITGAAGTIADDRYAAVHGYLGEPPLTTRVLADSTSSEGPARTGATFVSVPDAVPDVATTHLLTDLDRVFDGIGEGSSRIQLRVRGTLEGGEPFDVTRIDRFASSWDITIESVFDSYQVLSRLMGNRFAAVTVDRVKFTSYVDRDYRAFRVGAVKRLKAGTWVTIDDSKVLRVRPGTTLRLRVSLNRVGAAGSKILKLSVPIPERAAGRRGGLSVIGGDSYYERQRSTSFEDLLSDIASEVRNNQVVRTLRIQRDGADLVKKQRATIDAVVEGGFDVRVRVGG